MGLADLPHTSRLIVAQEVDESASLVGAALGALASMRFVIESHAAVLTLLAIGGEKMLKLSLGLASLDSRDGWPSRSMMRSYKHDLVRLNAEVLDTYAPRLQYSTVPGLLNDLIADWGSNEVGNAMLAAAAKWGEQGRFNRLDHLSGRDSGPPTSALWQDLEAIAIDQLPSLNMGDLAPGAYDRNRRELNVRLGSAISGWWEMHVRAWTTGVLGSDAKALGHALSRTDSSR